MQQQEQGSIEWKDAEYKYYGKYSGGLREGKPHGKGEFVQEEGRKKLIGEWDNGIKQGPFVRLYGNGFRWVGNYVNDLREGEWKYMYAGAQPVTNVYFYSQGHRVGANANGRTNHMDGLKVGQGLNPIY